MRTILALLAALLLVTPVAAKEAPLKPGKVHHLTSAKHGRPYSLDLSLPPLGALILQPRRNSA